MAAMKAFRSVASLEHSKAVSLAGSSVARKAHHLVASMVAWMDVKMVPRKAVRTGALKAAWRADLMAVSWANQKAANLASQLVEWKAAQKE